MKGSEFRSTHPVIEGHHDEPYTLRRFIDTDQIPQSPCGATKMRMDQFRPDVFGSSGIWTDAERDSVSDKSICGPVDSHVWKGEEETTTLWPANGRTPQLANAPAVLSHNAPGSNDPRQYLSTETLWHRLDVSTTPRENSQPITSDQPVSRGANQPFAPIGPAGYCTEIPYIVPSGPLNHPLGDVQCHEQQSWHVPFSSFQNQHPCGPANYAVNRFPSSAPSTISNSVSPLSSTSPEWPDNPAAAPQPPPPAQDPFKAHSYTSNPQICTDDVAQDMAGLDLSYRSSPFPAVNGQWSGRELPYQCGSTTALSSCSTPDGSFEMSDSTMIDDIGYQHAQTDPDSSQVSAQTWADLLSLQSFSEQTSKQAASGDKQGSGRGSMRASSQRNDIRDAFLVQCKRSGMSYKNIKEKGQFAEAESTLRGRFRTLTKRKEHRVRKPGWHEKDLKLLCEAVRRYTDSHGCQSTDDIRAPKISWKQVGEYIWNNGGSYHFGNATCKKKWEELHHGALI